MLELEQGKQIVNDKVFYIQCGNEIMSMNAIQYALLNQDESLVKKILNCENFNKRIEPHVYNKSKTMRLSSDCFELLYINNNFSLLKLIFEAQLKLVFILSLHLNQILFYLVSYVIVLILHWQKK